MSEFKFACPVCGQHITCDSATSGSAMECPTCYRKLVVPHPPAAGSPNLILTASEVNTRPASQAGLAGPGIGQGPAKSFPLAALMLGLVVCGAAAGVIVFREKIFNTESPPTESGKKSPGKQTPKVVSAPFIPPANDTNWTLNLAEVTLPDAPATGRINGRSFQLQKATIKGGTLDLRQGPKWPPDVGLTIQLFANQGEELAGKIVNLETNRDSAPRVTLRWKDEEEKPRTQQIKTGYAARLEFGEVAGNHLPGKIYLCAPDDAHSYVAGTFRAEIRKPTPPKAPKASKAKQ